MKYRDIFFCLLLSLSALSSYAQDNKELANQLVEIGDEILNSTFAYEQAKDQYLAALNADPDNVRANFMAGKMYLEDVNKGRAGTYFLRAYELDPNYSFDLLFNIGLAYHYDFYFDEAVTYYERYLEKLAGQPEYQGSDKVSATVVERKIYECGVGRELVQHPRKVSIVNLGSRVNSEYDDYAPVLNKDETLMIFTSRRFDRNLSQDVHTDNLPFEDMFYSVKTDSVWNYALNIGDKVNTSSHDSNLGVSKDGKELYIYNSDINNGDIFVSRVDEYGNWGESERLPAPINSEANENGASLSEDGRWIYFSSNRTGGLGGHDIYVSETDGKDGWKKPINLGPIINTEYDEEGPFIGYDGKTLYFSSMGGRGMGGFDIYRSEYDSAGQVWGIPVNLGYPINTPDMDVHFSPTEDGFRAYYATTRDDGIGNTDIYEITFIDDKEKILNIEPEPEMSPVTVRIKIIDDETGEPIDSRVEMKEESTSIIPIKEGDTYVFVLTSPEQKEYLVSAEKQGFGYYNTNMTFPGTDEEAITVERTIRMKKLVVGYSKILRNIYFDFDKSTLKDTSLPELNKLERMMLENPGMSVEIIGHTDNIGAEKYNGELSKRRAASVKTFLVNNNVDSRRVKATGMGSKKPLASNDDEKEGRELNRRVQLVVIDN
jgi:outer membrane protein OmpA-like peptidoglycan-associated protein/tetratricopeptide (TPR) repeat protein